MTPATPVSGRYKHSRNVAIILHVGCVSAMFNSEYDSITQDHDNTQAEQPLVSNGGNIPGIAKSVIPPPAAADNDNDDDAETAISSARISSIAGNSCSRRNISTN